MSKFVKIEKEQGKLLLTSPYYPPMITRCRQLNGKFVNGKWEFDERIETILKEACLEHYGECGEEVPRVTVRVDMDYFDTDEHFSMLGRVLLNRPARDYRVKLAEGVVVISGGFPSSGGSVKNPSICEKEGTVLNVYDVPLDLARKEKQKHPQGIQFEEPKKNQEESTQFLAARKALQVLTKEEITKLLEEFKKDATV